MGPDLVLLDQWCTGDRVAGQALFTRHFDSIYRFFEHKVGPDADDLAQRTFLACVAARQQFRRQSSFRTYLFTIARNEFFGHLRRCQQDQNVDFNVTSLADIVTSPSSRIGRAQKAKQVHAALARLPAEQQLLLELHYWHDLDAAALGEMLDADAGAIRVRLLRARRALRQKLAQVEAAGPADSGDDRLTAALKESEAHDGLPDRAPP